MSVVDEGLSVERLALVRRLVSVIVSSFGRGIWSLFVIFRCMSIDPQLPALAIVSAPSSDENLPGICGSPENPDDIPDGICCMDPIELREFVWLAVPILDRVLEIVRFLSTMDSGSELMPGDPDWHRSSKKATWVVI